MREMFLVLGIFILGLGLRSGRHAVLRKLGALVILVASFLAFEFLFGVWWAGFIGIALWMALPALEIFTRVRALRFPIENRLTYQEPPNPEHFPGASDCVRQIEEAGFEHITNQGWSWAGMRQFFRLYWNAESRQVAAVCLCEQEHVAFAFLTLTSQTSDRRLWRTTNYPFSPPLRCPPTVKWNKVPCERDCFFRLKADHEQFLDMSAVSEKDLLIPDPDRAAEALEEEMRQQIDHNLDQGLITLTGDGHFRYSLRGLFFLWKRALCDLVRLC